MNSEIEAKQLRLQAMRERYSVDAQQQYLPEPTLPNQGPSATFSASFENARPKPASSSGQGLLLQRILRFLEKPGAGGRLLAGTSISEERVQQLVNFLRGRSQSNHPLAKRLRWILGQLEQVAPGDEQIAGVSIRQLRRLLSVAQGSSGMGAEGTTSDASQPPRDPLQEALPKLDGYLDLLAGTLGNMEKTLLQLTAQFQEAQQQFNVLAEWREALQCPRLPASGSESVKSLRVEGKSERETAEWFSNFLD